MRKLLFFSMFFCITITNAQKIRFNYDSAGNQVLRTWCPTCPSRTANQPVKEIAKLDESDFQKFFPEDVISYYPNPVKEELYLKWDLINDNKVSSIDVFTLNGQVLKSIKENLSQNSLLISFQEYPIGVYFLNLNYINGEQKTIKIVKN